MVVGLLRNAASAAPHANVAAVPLIIPVPLVRMDRAHTRGTRQNDGLETGIMGATAATLAWLGSTACAGAASAEGASQRARGALRRCAPHGTGAIPEKKSALSRTHMSQSSFQPNRSMHGSDSCQHPRLDQPERWLLFVSAWCPQHTRMSAALVVGCALSRKFQPDSL